MQNPILEDLLFGMLVTADNQELRCLLSLAKRWKA